MIHYKIEIKTWKKKIYASQIWMTHLGLVYQIQGERMRP